MTTVASAAGPPDTSTRMRELVDASRLRSWRTVGSPERARPALAEAETDLRSLRAAHPLAPVYDVLHELLVEPAAAAGLIVAITDASGRLVWVEGDGATLQRAEAMAFVPGADWSESAVGTSAPGAALVARDGVQVIGEQHFAPAAHGFSCSAVPIRDPVTGALLGAIDVTGGADAVAPHALPLLRAAIAAAVGELRLRTADAPLTTAAPPSPAIPSAHAAPHLRLLGRDRAVLTAPNGAEATLSPRHSEILLLLAAHPRGLHGPQLADLLYREAGSGVTLRAEIARLRAVLAGLDPCIRLSAQPYRFEPALRTDVDDVLGAVDRGAHRRALREYGGAPLPASEAPGVEHYRERTHATLREAVLGHGGLDAVLALLALPGYDDDVDVNLLALRLLPPRSPRRAAIVARLTDLGR